MIDYLLLIPIAISFLLALFLIPSWIRKAATIGLVWEDMHKLTRHKVAGAGGIVVLLAFIAGTFLFIAYRVFYLHDESFLAPLLALILVIVFAALIGFVDDLIGWKRGGLTRSSRLLLVALSAVPLMAINAGKHAISLPLLGVLNLGALYPLILIPLGVIGATTTFNFLAGYNGLEAGQGSLLLIALSIVAFATGSSALAVISLCMVAATLAFLLFNFCPAKIFPGDSFTYAIGALVAGASIVGNFEKIALFFFIPYILEVFLKARGKLVKQSFGKVLPDNSLAAPYEKIYGLEHLAIKVIKMAGIKPTEKRVVYLLWSFQLIVIILGFIIFREGIFM